MPITFRYGGGYAIMGKRDVNWTLVETKGTWIE